MKAAITTHEIKRATHRSCSYQSGQGLVQGNKFEREPLWSAYFAKDLGLSSESYLRRGFARANGLLQPLLATADSGLSVHTA